MTTINTNTTSTTAFIVTPDTAGTFVVKTGSGSGTTAMTLDSSQNATFPGNVVGVLKSGTAVTASGSSVDFTSIPSTAKRITMQLVGVSTVAAGQVRIRLGTSGGLVTTGYAGGAMTNTTAPANAASALSSTPEGIGGFSTTDGTTLVYGQCVVTNVTGNTWIATSSFYRTNDSIAAYMNGSIALSGTLDRISLVATTSTFDAGTVNIMWE